MIQCPSVALPHKATEVLTREKKESLELISAHVDQRGCWTEIVGMVLMELTPQLMSHLMALLLFAEEKHLKKRSLLKPLKNDTQVQVEKTHVNQLSKKVNQS